MTAWIHKKDSLNLSFTNFLSVGHEKISTGHDGISTGLDTTAKKMKLGKYTGGGQQKEIAPPNQVYK